MPAYGRCDGSEYGPLGTVGVVRVVSTLPFLIVLAITCLLNEELIKLRIANLEEIKSGKMPDFSVVRDARPVAKPKVWE